MVYACSPYAGKHKTMTIKDSHLKHSDLIQLLGTGNFDRTIPVEHRKI